MFTSILLFFYFILETGVLSILDATTNDLAMLINNLDLQAMLSTPDMMHLRLSASIFPSPTPGSTLEKAKVHNNGSPTATTTKIKLAVKSSLSAKRVIKNSAVTRPDLVRQMSALSISLLRPYAQSRGYLAKIANNSVHAPITVAPTPSVGISSSASASSTKATAATIGNQASASLIVKRIAL